MVRMKILTSCHVNLWKHFRDEMKEWLAEVWPIINNNRPEWFTEDTIAKIPIQFFPGLDEEGVLEELGSDFWEKYNQFGQSRRATSLRKLESSGEMLGMAL